MKDFIRIFVLCLAAFFVNNTAWEPDIMECRNLVTAREIVNEGHWLVPTMNGELRLEKPPLPTWVAATIECVSPRNLSAQRAAAGVMGMLWVLFFYLGAKAMFGRNDYAYISTLIFLTCYNIVLMGRTASWDIYCHAFMMGAIWLLWKGLFAHDARPWRTLPWAGVLMGLSFLSKGPVSFYALLLPFLIAALAYERPAMRGKWGALATMLAICIALSAWWYVYLMAIHPQATDQVIEKESGSWLNHNVRPWHYYWRFFAETGQWALLTLATLAIPYWKKALALRREYLLTMTWMIASLVLLSALPEKKMRYLLPMMVPCAMAVGMLFLHFCHGALRGIDTPSKVLYKVHGWIVSIVFCCIPFAIGFILAGQPHAPSGFRLWLSIVAFALTGIGLLASTIRFSPLNFLKLTAIGFLLAECLLIDGIGALTSTRPTNGIAKVNERKELDNLPFYHVKGEEIRMELVYYAERKILPLDLADSAKVANAMPMVLVSRESADKVLPTWLLPLSNRQEIGTFDDNQRPKTDKHYNKAFLNKVTLITPKP